MTVGFVIRWSSIIAVVVIGAVVDTSWWLILSVWLLGVMCGLFSDE